MRHYNVDKQTAEIQQKVNENRLEGPEFIGQGCSYSPWTDTYGYYIVSISPDKKTVGLVHADSHFEKCWEDGNMVSEMPVNPAADEWAVKYGKKWYRGQFDRATGIVKRMPGQHWNLRWNGCYNYRDPSF